MMTSSTSSGATPARSSAPLMAIAPSSCAGSVAKAPLKEPTGGARGAGDDDICHGRFSSDDWRGTPARVDCCSMVKSGRVDACQRLAAAKTSGVAALPHLRNRWTGAPLPPYPDNVSVAGRSERCLNGGRAADHHQEIRQPAPLSHGHIDLCDARRPRADGEGRRGFRRHRRQDRRGHHPRRARPDHLRAGGPRPAPLLPIAFLRQLIRFYGDQMQTLLPTYLEIVALRLHPQPGQAARADGARAVRAMRSA